MDPTTADALRLVLMGLVVPVWLLAGLADWACHKWQRIERSAGVRESLLHWLMLVEIGVGLVAALLLQVNAAVLALLLACCVAHELTTWWDLAYAAHRRPIPVVEQWVHSLQLVLPWGALTGLAVLHWPQALALAGLGDAAADWGWRPKDPPLPPAYVAAVLTAGALLVALPFAEETLRCWRAGRRRGDGTRLPPGEGINGSTPRSSGGA